MQRINSTAYRYIPLILHIGLKIIKGKKNVNRNILQNETMKIFIALMKIAILICCNHAFPCNQLQSLDHVSRLAFPEENTCDFKCV